MTLLTNWETLERLLAAAALGSLIGFERERLLWSAGIRTHMLVSVGACLFMLVSAFGFAAVITQEHVVLDPSRVAAQVVSGIGFLGAGAILARGEVIRGLTTAASIWSVAAIGLAVGGGLYFAAAASTAIILLILAGVKPLEEAYRTRNQTFRIHVETARGALSPENLRQTLGIRTGRIKRFHASARNTKVDDVTVVLSKTSSSEVDSFVTKIGRLTGVKKVKILSRSDEDQ